MATVLFDSHTFIKCLRATGFTEEQAEVIVDASRDALENLVTKDDLRSEVVRIENRLDSLELRLTVKLGVFIAAAAGVIIAVLRSPML